MKNSCTFFKSLFLILVFTLIIGAVPVKAEVDLPEVLIKPFPILSWVPPEMNERQLGLYDEAGFTVLTMYPNEEEYKAVSKYWDGNYIVFKEWSDYTYDDMLAFHPEDENKIGYLLGDEPVCAKLPEYKVTIDKMRAADPQRICLVNLFPSYAGETRLGNGFMDYVKDSFEMLKPRYGSLDHYPLLWFDVQRPDFYSDIEVMRKFSMWNNSKQIGFVQLYSSTVCRNVSESDIAWQVNTFLAYGCKGLWYFNFRHPCAGIEKLAKPEVHKAGAKDYRTLPGVWTENYTPVYPTFGKCSVLDIEDNPSYAFDYVKNINAQVAAWGPILLALENTGVRHVVNRQPFQPVGTSMFMETDYVSQADEPLLKSVRAANVDQDKGFIVGYFKNAKDESYVMIVNKRFGEYMTCEGGKTKTIIAFDANVSGVSEVSKTDGKLISTSFANNKLTVDLDAGGAILLKITAE